MKEYVLIITQEEETLPPLAANVLTSRGGSLESLQEGLEFLKFGAPCMIDDMHDEEETDSGIGTLIEEQESLFPTVGETIVPFGGTLVVLQEVLPH